MRIRDRVDVREVLTQVAFDAVAEQSSVVVYNRGNPYTNGVARRRLQKPAFVRGG